MLTDAEADQIREGVDSGLRGPIVIKWMTESLTDVISLEELAKEAIKAPEFDRRPR